VFIALACIVLAYLIGSISSACVIAYIFGGIDMRSEPDGRVSAAEVHRKLGKIPFALTALLDILLSGSAVLLARSLTGSTTVMMIAGLAAVAGHNWSLLVKFKGGQGATAIAGVLFVLLAWQMIYILVIAALVMLFSHKSGLSSVIALGASPIVIWIQSGVSALMFFPVLLLCLMLLKKYQIARETSIAD
jgi:acyl phosphate:glycerol-3-phosphate acyltransferase